MYIYIYIKYIISVCVCVIPPTQSDVLTPPTAFLVFQQHKGH